MKESGQFAFALSALVFCLAVQTALSKPLPPLPDGEDCFTIAAFGDTQQYTTSGGGVVNPSFASRVDWLADDANRAAQNIRFVVHQGDIVNNRNSTAEWQFASDQMAKLDGKVPYAICPGNHDMNNGTTADFQQYFPASRYEDSEWYGGSFTGFVKTVYLIYGNNSNSYQLFEACGEKFIIFHLQCNAGKMVIDWVNDLLGGKYADRRAIMVTHQYLGAVTEEAEGIPLDTDQRTLGRMHWGKMVSYEAMDPQAMWRECFSRHKNIFLVLCGDQSAALSYTQHSRGIWGNLVHELCADYPHADDSDWIRLYRFFPKSQKIEVYTYSPQRDALCETAGYCTEERFHQFTLEKGDGGADVRIVRQDWPDEEIVTVDYLLSDPAGGGWDVTPELLVNGEPIKTRAKAYGGDLEDVRSGARRFTFDPHVCGVRFSVFTNATFRLTVTPHADSGTEVLYRAVSLDGQRKILDITRAELLSGKWGSVVTDYESTFQPSRNQIENPIIWTGITNFPSFKSDYLVFRKVKAGVDFPYTISNLTARVSQDYWLGVFEYTQAQYEKVYSVDSQTHANDLHRDMWFTNRTLETMCPVDNLDLKDITYDDTKILAQLRRVTGLAALNLPSDVQWEYACRAGTATDLYTGYNPNSTTMPTFLAPIARTKYDGWVEGATRPGRDADTSLGTAPVGSYWPNAFGFYDMLGNVAEWTRDEFISVDDLAAQFRESGTLVDPTGGENPLVNHIIRSSGVDYAKTRNTACNCRDEGDYYKKESARTMVFGVRWCMSDADFNLRTAAVIESDERPVAIDAAANPIATTLGAYPPGGVVPCRWPAHAARATLKITENGSDVIDPIVVARGCRDLVTDIAFELPKITKEEEETVLDFSLTFADASGAVLESETASLQAILGVAGDGAVIRRVNNGMMLILK